MVKMKVPQLPYRIEERLSNGTVYAAANYWDAGKAQSAFEGWIRFTARQADAWKVPCPLTPYGDRRVVLLGLVRTRLARPVVEGPKL